MNFEKLYTVDDIAKMTGLTSRTIRNYIKDGRLKGKKIGVQWRFTGENIKELFEDQSFSDTVEDAKNQMVIDYINRKETEDISACTVIDHLCSNEGEAEKLCNKVLEIINEYKKDGFVQFSYQYFGKYKKARFIIIGDIEGVKKVLDVMETTRL